MRDYAPNEFSPGHLANYRSYLSRWILPEFGDLRLGSITPGQVKRWTNRLAQQTGAVNRAPAKRWGYARVSTTAQVNDRQIDALTTDGIAADDIHTDKISGARQSRPGLDALLKAARPGDSITVASLDRLGRSALHVMQTIADLTAKGIDVRSLKESENMGGATGELMRGLMILVADWERKMNAERVAEARAARAARAAAGEQVAGRPRTALSPSKLSEVKRLRAKGHGASDIAKLAEISRASAYRALAALDA